VDMETSKDNIGELNMPLIMALTDFTEVNGPGKRALIHFQGCDLGCPGCFNPQSHPFDNKKETPVHKVIDWVKGLKEVEGITVSGGEPIQQAQYLYLILHAIRKERPDLSIGMFTGYTTKELELGKFKWKSTETGDWKRGSPELWNEIKSMLDWAVLGRYNQTVKSVNDPLRGSLNQEVIFYTNRYSEANLQPQMVEVQIDEDALVQITGFPNEQFREAYPLDGDKLVTTLSSTPKLPSTSKGNNDGEDLVCA
jgi:anaerobic ribonucleoside-triphosphate reductase activating protein